ncbi:unnamed protein product [Leuciscus chuanchicus]
MEEESYQTDADLAVMLLNYRLNMSYGNMNIPRKDGMDREDEEEMNIYANVDPISSSYVRTETENSQTPQHTGSDTVRNRSSRATPVCLALLCVLLLTAVIVLCVHIKTKSTNYTEETHQLLTKISNLTEERDELLTAKLSRNYGWIYYKSSLYFISSEKKNWTESRRYCTERGADLITINNREEQGFVKNISANVIVWTGLTDRDVENTWKWVDGSTPNSGLWASEEPDSRGGIDEDCAVNHEPGLADYPCDRVFQWICEEVIVMEKEKRFRQCASPCPRYLSEGDTHVLCVVCLGVEHARAALEGAVCANCDLMPLRMLRSRLGLFDESGQARAPHGSGPASVEAARRLHSWGSQRDLADNVETAAALSQHSSASSHGPAREAEARPAASSAREEDPMLELSGSEGSDNLNIEAGESETPSSHSPAFEELLEVVTRAVGKLNIEWPPDKQEATKKSMLDERFLQARPQPSRRSLPFFPDLHTEVSRSWNKPLSSRLSSPNVHIYSSIVGSKEKGYGTMPRVEENFASHLSPDAASSLRAPALPSKPCRTTSALVGKAYMAAGRAGACLHTMGLLQAYQADLLKEVDDSGEVSFDDICEMRRAVDLSLRATKETARAIGRSMAALVATERHLWLNLSGIGEREKTFLLDAPISSSGLFGDAVNTVVDRFQETKRQSAALKHLIPRRRSKSHGSAARGQSQEAAASSSHMQQQKESVASRAPPRKVWVQGQHSQPKSSGPRTDLRTVIQARKASAKRS